MKEQDSLRRFILTDANIRGEWLSLSHSWQDIKSKHQYPEVVSEQLGYALGAVVLLAGTLKFEGSLILQTQTDGDLHLLVAQCDNHKKIRGMARFNEQLALNETNDQPLFGQGRLVMSVEQDNAEPYQGIVALKGDKLNQSVEEYFKQSEQLSTRLWVFVDEHQVSGLFIQQLPGDVQDDEDWRRIEMLAETITGKELLTLSCEQILHRLFHEENLRLFDAEDVQFECKCSIKKIENTLHSLGREELEEILNERDYIHVDCEFCNQHYNFDKVDVERILSAPGVVPETTKTQH